MFSLRELCFVLCSRDLDVLSAQRTISFLLPTDQRGRKIRSHGRVDEVVRKCTRREINKYEKRMGEWASKIKHWMERRIDGKKMQKGETEVRNERKDGRKGGREEKE